MQTLWPSTESCLRGTLIYNSGTNVMDVKNHLFLKSGFKANSMKLIAKPGEEECGIYLSLNLYFIYFRE